MALRQTTGFVESLLRLVGLDWAVPDFSTLSRRQKALAVTIPYRGSQGPLNLLIDSTGIKAEGEGEWHARKHGGAKRRLWRKIHIGVDEQTLEIRALEITGSTVGDAPMLPELLSQIPPDVEIGSVTADGAYDTRKCHDAVADRGAHEALEPDGGRRNGTEGGTSRRRSSRSFGRSTCWYRRADRYRRRFDRSGVTQFTYYRWRKEFGGLKTDQVKRLKELEKENERLRKAVSDLTLEKLILREAASGNF